MVVMRRNRWAIIYLLNDMILASWRVLFAFDSCVLITLYLAEYCMAGFALLACYERSKEVAFIYIIIIIIKQSVS